MKIVAAFFISILLADFGIRKVGIFGQERLGSTIGQQQKGKAPHKGGFTGEYESNGGRRRKADKGVHKYFTAPFSMFDLEAAVDGRKDEHVGIFGTSYGAAETILKVGEVFGKFQEYNDIVDYKVDEDEDGEVGDFKVVFYSPDSQFPTVRGNTVSKELTKFTQAAVQEIMRKEEHDGFRPIVEVFRLIQEEFKEYSDYFLLKDTKITECPGYGKLTPPEFFWCIDDSVYIEYKEAKDWLEIDVYRAEYSFKKNKPMALQSLFENALELLQQVTKHFSAKRDTQFKRVEESYEYLYRYLNLLPLVIAKKLGAMMAADRLIFVKVDNPMVVPGSTEEKTRLTYSQGKNKHTAEHNFFINTMPGNAGELERNHEN